MVVYCVGVGVMINLIVVRVTGERNSCRLGRREGDLVDTEI